MTDGGEPSAPAAELRPAATAPRTHRLSIRDFVTDGSLAALCAELSAIAGVTVRVRDESGVALRPGGGPADPGDIDAPAPGTAWIPMQVQGQRIGSITISPGSGTLSGAGRERFERAVELLARSSEELCTDVVELRQRIREIEVLGRLGTLLATGGKVQDTLRVALESALDALGLQAGSVVLLPEDADALASSDHEADMIPQAWSGISESFVRDPTPLSRGREFDKRALAGESVMVEDLLRDPRVIFPEGVRREGVRSFLNAGLISGGRPIGVIRLYGHRPRVFSPGDVRIVRAIAQQAAAAVEQARLARLKTRERRTQTALRIAGAVQQRMLPREMPRFAGLDVAARYQPSMELGGDFYDLFDLHGRLAVVVGDVVGKGIPAALLMSAVRASLRAHAETERRVDKILDRVNAALCRDTTVNEFATVWLGAIDPATRTLEYAGAGHDPPMLLRIEGGRPRAQTLEVGGLVVGVLPEERYAVQRVQLRPGDVLLAYTDGLTDARNFEDQRFGKARLAAAIEEAVLQFPEGPADLIAERLRWGVRQFTGLKGQADDETAVVVRVS